jgi:hypothetical protein
MRILYAANNSFNSYFQLKRFISSIRGKNIDIKIAAYKSSMGDLNVDYTLDALLNFTNPDANVSFNGNYTLLYNEIKRFSPDLIISDVEVYTAIIASEMNIPLWIVSPFLMYAALDKKTIYNIGLHKKYSYLFTNNFRKKSFLNFIIKNADRRFIVSHLCDTNIDLYIKERFEFVRPDFILANEDNKTTDYLLVSQNNKTTIDKYKNTNSVMFTDFIYEKYPKLTLMNIYDDQKYKQYLSQTTNIVCDGNELIAADAFYNEIDCVYSPNYNDISAIAISQINSFYGKQDIKLNNRVKFLSEHL